MDILLAILLGISLLLFGFLCMGRVLFPCGSVHVVVPATGEGENLQQILYGLMWLRGLGLLSCTICLEDQGLSQTGRELVTHLLHRWPDIALCQGEK